MDQESLVAGITASVTHYPHKTAIKSETRFVSYYELERKSNQLANFIYGKIRKVPHIVIILDRSPELIEAIIGVLKCGFVFVPLSPEFPENRVRQMINEAQAEWVITSHEYYGKFEGIFSNKENYTSLKILLIEADNERNDERENVYYLSPQLESEVLLFDRVPKENCYIYFTSGSTGVPKAVLGRCLGLYHFIQWEMNEFEVDQNFNVSQLTPPSFDPFLRDIFVPLMAGATSCIPSSDTLMSAGKMIRWIDENNITLMHTVPSFFKRLSSAVEDSDCLNNLKYILLAGELLRGRDISRFLKIFKDRIQLVNIYGPTETTLAKLFYRIKSEDVARSVIPVGKPIDGAQVLILDSKMRKSRRGKKGELYIRTPFLSSGYYNDPELTEKVFIKNPFGKLQNDIIYKTGDLGRLLPDENIELSGRVDSQVKIRGVRIELGEIENRLLAYKDIREAVVTVRNDPGDDSYLCAYVVANSGEKIDPSVLRKYLAGDLPEFMIPSFFIFLEQIPLLYNGKIDRSRLPDPKDSGINTEEDNYLAPKSNLEKQITRVWQEVLQLKKLSTNSNFFDLGGNSLKIMEVESKLSKEYKREIPLAKLFEHSTISSLAEYIGGIEAEKGVPGIRRASRSNKTSDARGKKKTRQSFSNEKKLNRRVSEVAVVGMACRFPGARDVQEFWDILREARETISFFSGEEILASGVDRELANHPDYVKAASRLAEKEFFDAFFFGYTPREAELLEPQLRIFHECAWEALEDSCIVPDFFEGQIGVFAGAVQNLTWPIRALLSGKSQSMGEFAAGKLIGVRYLCTRLSYNLNLKGPSVAIQTACSTSLVAVHMACRALIEGGCDAALAGGVTASPEDRIGYLYEEGMIFSPDGHCRAFDSRGNGTIFGEGVGIVVLKLLDKALADRDHVYAVIKGSAINNDGNRKVGFTAPSVKGQVEVIRAALDSACIESGSIDYVETHGTATKMGDSIEIEALAQVFNAGKKRTCRLGSVKSNFGHLDAAAGIAGFIKTVLALNHRMIPPSLHFESPNPGIKFDNSPLVVNNSSIEWKSDGIPLRAGVSSMGMGGTNAHVILEEPPATENSLGGRAWKLILLSARTGSALDQMTSKLVEFLRENAEINLADVAFTLQIGRQGYKYRKMALCSSVDETVAVLSDNSGSKVLSSRFGDENRPVFFMFPGLGSQYVNMGQELYETEPVFRNEMDHCFDILSSITDVEFKNMLFPGTRQPPPDIKRIDIAQIVVFVLEYALTRLLMQWGITPHAMIGYSFGEYVAACISGVFSLEDALELVVSRGKLLQRIPPGAMISVPLTREQLSPLLGDGLSLAIDNGESCVVAGSKTEVDAFEKRMKDNHYICIRLSNVMAIHSSQVEPILGELEAKVRRIRLSEPQIPYISNVTGQWITVEQARDPEYWARHLRQTVLFADGLNELLKEPNSIFIEIGPGGDLSTLVHRYLEKDSTSRIINLIRPPRKKVSDAYYLHSQIGKLWLYGQQIDWHRFYTAEKRYRVPLPTYPFERQRYWIDGVSIPTAMGSMSPRSMARDLGEGIYIPVWKPSVLSMGQYPRDTAGPSCWLVFMHRDSRLGSKIAKRLEEEGSEVIRVLSGTRFNKRDECTFTVNPCKGNHYRRLMDGLGKMNRIPTRIVHMWNVIEMAAGQSETNWNDQMQDLGIYSLLFLAGAIDLQVGSGADKIEITVVTSKMQRIPGQDMGYPEKATLLGFVNAVSGKYPYIECRSIDIVTSDSSPRQETKLINQLIWEVTSPSANEPQVAYRRDDRMILNYEQLQAKPKEISTGSTSSSGEGRVYLITGELEGIGSVLAHLLARWRGVKLISIQWSRTGGKEPQFQEKTHIVKQLENLGASVLVLIVDINEREQIKQAVSYAQKEFGSINGVIHQPYLEDSAGEKNGMVLEKTAEDLSANLANVRGLEDIFGDKVLDFFVFCSTTVDFSTPDPIIQAAVSAFFELNACYRSPGNRFRTVSIVWPDFKALKPGRVLEKVKDVFQLILNISLSRVIVGVESGDRDDTISGHDLSQGDDTADSLYGRPELSTEYVAPTSDVELRLTEIFQNFLGIEQIGILDDFLELGIDSLKTINLGIEIFNELNVRIPLAHLFDLTNIKEMAEYMANSINEETSVTGDTGLHAPEVSGSREEVFVIDKSWDVTEISESMESPKNLLVTGITGFLGVHVLRELCEKTDIRVFCLVRADMLDDTVKRAKEIWDFYFDRPFNEYLDKKLFFYKGDLTQSRMGMDETGYNDLASRIDSVIHCAADVRHYGRYENFKRTNVDGTRRILDFCFHGNEKKMHYVSTIAIMGHPSESINFKESDLDIGQNLDEHVYSKSKFEAEKLVYRARHDGLKASIYRIGNLVGRFTDGFFQKNIETNYLYNHIKAIIMLKKFPSTLNEVTFEMTPIDVCSRSLVNLVLLKDAVGYNYHLLNPNNLTFKTLFQHINDYGYFIETVDLETFSNQIYAEIQSESFRNEIEISRIFYLLRGRDGNREGVNHNDVRVTIDSTFTVEVLKKTGFNWCELDYSFIVKMLKHCINVGYIKSPNR